MPEITSTQNARVKALRALREPKTRRKAGLMLIEGEKMLGEARACGLRVSDVLYDDTRIDAATAGPGAVSVSAHVLESLCETVSPQGIVAAVEPPKQLALADVIAGARANGRALLIAALDGVQDPGNVGTILRTADAFDCDGVFLVNACADPYSPKTARATMGAVFRRNVYQCTADELCALLQKCGLPLYGTALRNDTVSLRDAELSRAAVAIGSEGRGLSAEILSKCEKTIKIPMSPRCESLNAAVAASVVLWEMYR